MGRAAPETGRGSRRRGTARGGALLVAGRHVLSSLVDVVWPQTCAACALWIPGDMGLLCPDCLAEIEAAAALPACPRCGRTASPLTMFDGRCGLCRHERHWNVAGIARIGEYHIAPLQRMLQALKFGTPDRPAAVLGQWLAAALRRQPWIAEIDVLVPVPMHWLRRWQRPCDHAQVLAEAVSERIHIPVHRSAVRREKYTRSQTRARSATERFRNVRGCFEPARRPAVAGRNVCIIDNLVVTGATLHEVAKVLRQAGARRIWAAVAARSGFAGDREVRIPTTNPAEETG